MSTRPVAPDGDQEALVRSWLRVVASTAYVPRSAQDLAELLASMLATLTAALVAEPFDTGPGSEVGARMVTGALTGEETLSRSLGVLAGGLLAAGHHPERVVVLLAAVSSGYATALRARTLEQQEDMKRAMLSAARLAEQGRKDTEYRFREVFTASAIGIAITGVDGRFLETNPALAAILDRGQEDLRGHLLSEYFVDQEADRSDPASSAPDRKRVVRPDGDTAWVLVNNSVVRDDSGEPVYRVSMVQDLSELELLGTRLTHQSLHDALTGLPNRLHFQSRLEVLLGQAHPAAEVTLLCLDLDAFGLVNTTHGHAAGDRLLRAVAHRLAALVEDEPAALVARVGGDEFAVFVVDGPSTPDIPGLVALVRAELTEPDYDGKIGLAATASIGVVRCAAADVGSAELFRAADAALHRAKAAGPDQWAVHDPHVDRRARRVGAAATSLPSAWELGELVVAYRPVARLADRAVVRVSAVPHLPGARGALPPPAELAERTGLSVALAPWLLREAAEQLPVWQELFPGAGPVLRVTLTRAQTADADLVGAVSRALAQAALPAHLLEVVLDTAAVRDAHGDARDNLRTLGDLGVGRGLHGFTGGPALVELVERFGVGAVLLADPFDGWRPDWLPGNAVAVRATAELIAAVGSVGAEVGVVGVRDQAEASWWADRGASTGEGPAFGGPVGVPDVVRAVRGGNPPPSERIAPT